MRVKSLILLLTVLCSCLNTSIQPSFSKALSSQHTSEEKFFNATALRIRVRPTWVSKVPKRGINRWIDRERGIYQTPSGDIIGPYSALVDALKQKPNWLPGRLRKEKYLEAHHLIEKRVARIFGFDPNDLPAVVLSRVDHRGKQGIHNEIYKLLPKVRGGSAIAYKDSLAKIQQAYQRVYSSQGKSDWLEPITAVMQEWSSR